MLLVIIYIIYYGNVSRSYTQKIDAKNITTYTVSNLDNTKQYYFAVTAYTTTSEGYFSNEVSLPPAASPTAPPAPAAPSSLSVTAVSTSQINLSWTDNATNETGYKIERAPALNNAAGTFTQIATVGANVKTYANTGLSANTSYYYRVRAYNDIGDSAYSSGAYARTLSVAAAALSSNINNRSLDKKDVLKGKLEILPSSDEDLAIQLIFPENGAYVKGLPILLWDTDEGDIFKVCISTDNNHFYTLGITTKMFFEFPEMLESLFIANEISEIYWKVI